MKGNSVIRVTGVCVVACCAALAAFASGAFGAATGGSAAGLKLPVPPIFGFGSVVGNCPSSLLDPSANIEFSFTSGSFVSYGPSPNPATGGHNVQGHATLSVDGVPLDQGHTHFWDGTNVAPSGSGQNYDGTTVSFQGSSISFQGTFGGTTSASGHESGWFHLKVTCS